MASLLALESKYGVHPGIQVFNSFLSEEVFDLGGNLVELCWLTPIPVVAIEHMGDPKVLLIDDFATETSHLALDHWGKVSAVEVSIEALEYWPKMFGKLCLLIVLGAYCFDHSELVNYSHKDLLCPFTEPKLLTQLHGGEPILPD
jgi:hypothetical protein